MHVVGSFFVGINDNAFRQTELRPQTNERNKVMDNGDMYSLELQCGLQRKPPLMWVSKFIITAFYQNFYGF